MTTTEMIDKLELIANKMMTGKALTLGDADALLVVAHQLRTPGQRDADQRATEVSLESADAAMGRKGGKAPKPTSAENGKKGGRPKKSKEQA